jgi:hypothetical protein
VSELSPYQRWKEAQGSKWTTMRVAEPSADMCSDNAPVTLPDGNEGIACWYPSMGGYAGKAVMWADDDAGVNVLVWHNGDFPFPGEDPVDQYPRAVSPAFLHHCDPEGFVRFGQLAERLEAVHDQDTP